MPSPEAVAHALAHAHHQPTHGLPDGPHLVDYAESSRVGDWSLRSALVRFAQPEPMRAGAVLELIRRTDGALKPHRRRLERALAPAHPLLGLPGSAPIGDDLAATVADAPAADLARALVRLPDGAAVVAAYAAAEELSGDDVAAVHLLAVAVALDGLADELAAWAFAHHGPPPVAVVERQGAAAHARLEALGVPREDGPRRPPPR